MDFVHDTLSGGGRMRVLAVIDVYTRECVALRAGRGFRGDDVVRILTEACKQRGGVLPEVISVTNLGGRSVYHRRARARAGSGTLCSQLWNPGSRGANRSVPPAIRVSRRR